MEIELTNKNYSSINASDFCHERSHKITGCGTEYPKAYRDIPMALLTSVWIVLHTYVYWTVHHLDS